MNNRIGKEIGSDGVVIKIDAVDDDFVHATVISVDDFWKDRVYVRFVEKNGVEHWSRAFEIGMGLKIKNGRIVEPENLPWFVLMGDKFVHYR